MNTTITEDEAELLAMGWELRLAEHKRGKEFWMVTQPWLLPEADRLHGRGWLSRRIGDDIQWRLTDEGITALRLNTLASGQSSN
jgi:hypothetical protein